MNTIVAITHPRCISKYHFEEFKLCVFQGLTYGFSGCAETYSANYEAFDRHDADIGTKQNFDSHSSFVCGYHKILPGEHFQAAIDKIRRHIR